MKFTRDGHTLNVDEANVEVLLNSDMNCIFCIKFNRINLIFRRVHCDTIKPDLKNLDVSSLKCANYYFVASVELPELVSFNINEIEFLSEIGFSSFEFCRINQREVEIRLDNTAPNEIMLLNNAIERFIN